MKSIKRVLFAVGLVVSVLLCADPDFFGISEDFQFLTVLPLTWYGLAIASRFWSYGDDT
jgi:hypothetical protein